MLGLMVMPTHDEGSAMLTEADWLPVGSVVLLEDGLRPVMIAGFMALDETTDTLWDYVGYPYPWGHTGDSQIYFDRSMVVSVYLIGYLNNEGLILQDYLMSLEEEFMDQRTEAFLEAGMIDSEGNVIVPDDEDEEAEEDAADDGELAPEVADEPQEGPEADAEPAGQE